jgi:hypothetical protein
MALPKIESAHAVTDTVNGQQLEYQHLLLIPDLKPIWERAFANELGRLAQGIRDVIGTNTIEFIFTSKIPRDRTVTYGRLVCDIRPQNTKQHCVRLAVGGDRVDYPGETSTKNADLTTSQCLWNSVIPTEAAMYICADVKKSISTPSLTAQSTCAWPSTSFTKR